VTWVALGAPFDSAAEGEGEERAPQALRDAGLIEALGARDRGDVARPLRPPERDPHTGIIAFESLVDGSEAIAKAVAETIEAGDRPLVLGGDCSFLVGVFAGLRSVGRDAGLLFVDGHCDYWDGETSPTGEFADMELGVLHGHGPDPLVGSDPPLLALERTAIVGHRPAGLDPEVAAERARVPGAVLQVDTKQLREGGVDAGAALAIERVGEPVWIHLDLDVLDQAVLPAVSYPQAEGLDWDELEVLMAPMMDAPGLLGLSIADLNSDKDPAGEYAARVVTLLETLGSSRPD
jgi:arginase